MPSQEKIACVYFSTSAHHSGLLFSVRAIENIMNKHTKTLWLIRNTSHKFRLFIGRSMRS
jgi:hypothetical protein